MSIRAGTDRHSAAAGFALPMVLVVLVALGIIGGAAAMVTATDEKVAGLYNFSNRAGAAAMAGLEHATGHYLTNGPTVGWPVGGQVNGYSYTVTIARDVHDFGSGAVNVSYDEDTDTYNGTGTGEPVYVLQATAWNGNVRAVQRMRITQRTMDVEADAALQSNSGVELQGNITVSGVNATIAGVPKDPSGTSHAGACDENKPAIKMTDASETVDAQGSVTMEGNSTYAANDPPFVQYDDAVKWHSPEEALGLEAGALDSYKQSGSQYGANRPDTLAGIVYITDDFGSTGACATAGGCGNIQGTGILIVHNPLYHPREHDPADAMYDAAKAGNPLYAPANMGNINGGTFKGIIIADKVNKISGDVEIYGAIMSLTEIDVDIIGAGTAVIQYSCDAINLVEGAITQPVRLTWMAD